MAPPEKSPPHARRPRTLVKLDRVSTSPTPPYSFRGSAFKPSHFRTADHAARDLAAWQTVRVGERLFGVRLTGNDDVWRPRVHVSVYGEGKISSPQLSRLLGLLRRRYDMESDITPFVRLAKRAPRARSTLRRWIGSRPTCAYSLYELLVILICLQNARVRRTETMMRNLFGAYGRFVRFDGQSLWSFWTPRALVGQENRLRDLRLGYRAKSLERLSRYFAQNGGDFEDRLWELSDGDLRAALQEIPAVGPATANGLMFDYFHRYDSLVYLPPWETKIYRRLLHQPNASSEKLVALAHQNWPGYSMLALHILFEDQFWRMREHRPHVLEGLAPPP